MRLLELQEKWDKVVLRLEKDGYLVKRVDPQGTTAKDTTKHSTNTTDSPPTKTIGAIMMPPKIKKFRAEDRNKKIEENNNDSQ